VVFPLVEPDGVGECTESKVAVAVAQGQFRNAERGTTAVGIRYQRTGKGTADWEDSARVCSQLQTV
jgi:hypothetical protein